jgi:hypothetical protein
MPLYPRDPSSLLHPHASGGPTSDDPPDSLDTYLASSAYDLNGSNLPYRTVYTTSATNPESLLNVFENIHSNTIATPSCHSVAMTFILDTPLLIRFHLQEPPPPPPVPSHHRFLSRFPDWRGTPQQFSYSIEVPLQPGVNHVVWCKHRSRGGMNTSFLPPCDGDWPTISPHPTAEGLAIHFYSLQGDSAVNRLCYK